MKKAIVVGASSGMGYALAERLSADYLVGITGRREDLLIELKLKNPPRFVVSAFDVTDTAIIERKLNQLVQDLGGLDLLVISAGTGEENDSLEFGVEKKTADVNVLAFTQVAAWTYRFFLLQKHGHLVAITSVAGIRGSRQAPSYSASKSYQIKYLEALRQKSCREKTGIWVTDLRPGFVDTKMAKSALRFWVAPVQVATNQIYKAIHNKRAIVYVTKRWRLVAWILKIIPGYIYKRL